MCFEDCFGVVAFFCFVLNALYYTIIASGSVAIH